jgi:hypothetical protein
MEHSQSWSNGPSLMKLPLELHLQISSYLSYPDALALKHCSRHFYSVVYTGVHLKVDWLVDRFERKLECPMEKCSFRTDESFCNHRVRGIMERRRWHLECRAVRSGCIVVPGNTCRTDSLPTWFKLKAQGRRRVVRRVWVWGQEGMLFFAFHLLIGGSSWLTCIAFLVGIMAIVLNLLWLFAQR